MYTCTICDATVKTRQGLAGHHRFRHEGKGYVSNYRPVEKDPGEQPATVQQVVELQEAVKSLDRLARAMEVRLIGMEELFQGQSTSQEIQQGVSSEAALGKAFAEGTIELARSQIELAASLAALGPVAGAGASAEIKKPKTPSTGPTRRPTPRMRQASGTPPPNRRPQSD